MLSQIRETERQMELEKKFPTAQKLGLDYCNKCGYCCHRRPCVPTPDEFEKIAEFLDLTPGQLIHKYYAIDSYHDIYFLKPIGINQKDLVGKYIPGYRTFNEGKCIFLTEDNLCEIYDVRPQSAKNYKIGRASCRERV